MDMFLAQVGAMVALPLLGGAHVRSMVRLFAEGEGAGAVR